MCVNQRWIVNKYNGKDFYVKCGHCEACLQEKAVKRATRIRNQVPISGQMCLFVTLTYAPDSVPWVFKADLENRLEHVNIFRSSLKRYVRYKKDYSVKCKTYDCYSLLDVQDFPDYSHFKKWKTQIKPLVESQRESSEDRIGIIYYPDLQKFLARLRINLYRYYNVDKTYSIKYFGCAEYGKTTFRPHFHILLFFDKKLYAQLRKAIFKSWPYADKNRLNRGIEIARDPAGYVSSYVNCGADFPSILAQNFPQKHSYSKGFGLALRDFQLRQILEKIQRGNLTYSIESKRSPAGFINIPLPKYVINRYFPYFKGNGAFTHTALFDILRDPANYGTFARWSAMFDHTQRFPFTYYKVHYDIDLEEDVHKVQTRLENAYQRYISELDIPDNVFSRSDYARNYIACWNLYRSWVYRCFAENTDVPIVEKYCNLLQVQNDFDLSDNDNYNWVYDKDLQTDPNKFISNVEQTNLMTSTYHSYLKYMTINNGVQSSIYGDL